MKSIRIDKYLADLQVGTRSQVKQLLKKGLVTVNGTTISKPDIKVDPAVDRVFFNGKPLSYEREVYYMLHKPAGVVSATRDNHDQTVVDLIAAEDRRDDLFPVGRLDKDTTGLLLLTNDGALSHRLLSPRHHVDKTYLVKTDSAVTQAMVASFKEGLDIGDEKPTLPAILETKDSCPDLLLTQVSRWMADHLLSARKEVQDKENRKGQADEDVEALADENGKVFADENGEALGDEDREVLVDSDEINLECWSMVAKEEINLECWSMVTIQEGRFHQIKRMFHAVGTEVVILKRLRMGSLILDSELQPGAYRALTTEEIQQLQNVK